MTEAARKKWYRQPWFKIATFLLLTPVWVLIVLFDPDERKSVKFVAAVVLIVYVVLVGNSVSQMGTTSSSLSLYQQPSSLLAVVTKAEYDQIQEQMTYEQVCAIIGAKGEELSRSDLAGYTTIMYQWANANGSNMNAMFQNNRLVTKAQFGLP